MFNFNAFMSSNDLCSRRARASSFVYCLPLVQRIKIISQPNQQSHPFPIHHLTNKCINVQKLESSYFCKILNIKSRKTRRSFRGRLCGVFFPLTSFLLLFQECCDYLMRRLPVDLSSLFFIFCRSTCSSKS